MIFHMTMSNQSTNTMQNCAIWIALLYILRLKMFNKILQMMIHQIMSSPDHKNIE